MSATLVPAAIRYAEQVARSGSIQRAARELNVAASAVDRQILKLEASLGVKLFERLPRGMRPTEAGGAVVELCRRWRADERRIAAELLRMQGVNQGHVRVVAMDSHANGLLPRVLEGLSERHPRLSLDVEIATTDAAVSLLLDGSVDVAVAYNLRPRRELHTLWSGELPFGAVVAPGHRLAREATVSLQEVAAHPLALQNRSLAIRRILEARHGWLLGERPAPIESNSLQLIKRLAQSGRYAALTSELDAAPEILDGTLVFVPVRDAGAEPQTVGVAIDARRPLPRAAQTVTALLVEEVQALLRAVRGRRKEGSSFSEEKEAKRL